MTDTNRKAATVEEEAAAWLARQDRRDWDAAQQAGLDAWLAADTRHRVAWLRLRAAWGESDALRGSERAPAATPPLARFSPWRIAAGVALACALGAQLASMRDDHGVQRYATAVGESRLVALADGSRVTLNTDTRLRSSQEDARTVWLDSGEAYFDVAHDPAHPFVIEAGASRITVLGTRFTVRREDGGTRVLVAQGRVRVSDGAAAVELAPDEEALAHAGAIARSVHDAAHTDRQLAWREGRIVFDRTPLGEAVDEFNRYNARKIVVDSPEVAGIVLGGSFAPTNVDGFLRLLEQGFGLRTERRGKDVVISR
ncbi:FecR family protein [Massilia sp. CFBP9026]|uniref:FecR family protein n=1 Tax=Massilia sp. CFBP9026 TaxID=3096536 RepID=UPI002A6B4621|nr:FecR domain-containing protein [Massilia sp. CFBP9026]MDY0961097.1 FecR domain-containing protein [Massilia sp. CFBP9026]